jgi:hypothetical protein
LLIALSLYPVLYHTPAPSVPSCTVPSSMPPTDPSFASASTEIALQSVLHEHSVRPALSEDSARPGERPTVFSQAILIEVRGVLVYVGRVETLHSDASRAAVGQRMCSVLHLLCILHAFVAHRPLSALSVSLRTCVRACILTARKHETFAVLLAVS